MKKRILSIFVFSAIALTAFSCSDDDKTIQTETNPLIGKWYITETIGNSFPSNDCEKRTNYQFTNTILNFEEYRLNKGGNCSLYLDGSSPYEISKGKLMVDGIEISEDKLITDGTEIYFTVNGNNLTLFFNVEGKYIVEQRYIKRK